MSNFSRLVSKQSDMFCKTFKCSGNILSCLAACPDCSVFQNVPKLLVCLEIFQIVLEYFKKIFLEHFKSVPKHLDVSPKCSRTFSLFRKLSDLFWEYFKNVLENFQDCSKTFRFDLFSEHFKSVLEH